MGDDVNMSTVDKRLRRRRFIREHVSTDQIREYCAKFRIRNAYKVYYLMVAGICVETKLRRWLAKRFDALQLRVRKGQVASYRELIDNA